MEKIHEINLYVATFFRSVFKEMWSGEDNLKALKMNIKHHE